MAGNRDARGMAEPSTFGDHCRMATKTPKTVKSGARTGMFDSAGLRGKRIGDHFVLVHIGDSKRAAVRPADKAAVLVGKAARALKKPGIDKAVVFRGAKPEKVFAYSVYPADTSRVIRESADGKRSVGRLGMDGRFRASRKVA